jgi:hypothetical protein
LQKSLVILSQNNISAKAAHKILMKLSTVVIFNHIL